MGTVIRLIGSNHARAPVSDGYKSGLSSCRGTPDTLSTAKTRSGGTSSHCEIACAVMPSNLASRAWPPALSTASSSADRLFIMAVHSSIALLESQAPLHCEDKGTLYDAEMTLGKRIKAARERLRPKMTQGDLGKFFDITDKAVSGWERDDTLPALGRIVEIARILKVPTAWLLDGKGPPPHPDSIEAEIDSLDPQERAFMASMLRHYRQERGKVA